MMVSQDRNVKAEVEPIDGATLLWVLSKIAKVRLAPQERISETIAELFSDVTVFQI